jgi:hypothetical protein
MRLHTDNSVQIKDVIIPAYQRELAGAKAKGDKDLVAAIESEIKAVKAIAGMKSTTEKVAPEAREKAAKAEADKAAAEAEAAAKAEADKAAK